MQKTEVRQQWIRSLENKMKHYKMNSINNVSICDLHFEKHHIQRYYVTKLENKVVKLTPRKRPTLLKSSVPCIFPQSIQPTIINEKVIDITKVNKEGDVIHSTETVSINTNEEHIMTDSEIHPGELDQPSTSNSLVTNNTLLIHIIYIFRHNYYFIHIVDED